MNEQSMLTPEALVIGLSISVVVLLFLGLAAKSVFRILARLILLPFVLLGWLTRPIRRPLKALGLIGNGGGAGSATAVAGAWAVLQRAARSTTETELALRYDVVHLQPAAGDTDEVDETPDVKIDDLVVDIDNLPDLTDENAEAFQNGSVTVEGIKHNVFRKKFDFHHQNVHLKRNGILFKWIEVIVGYIEITEEMSTSVISRYFDNAELFFKRRVSLRAYPHSLYEDVETAYIVRLFSQSDRGCFYLLHEARKLINANVRNMTMLFSAIMSVAFILNIWNASIDPRDESESVIGLFNLYQFLGAEMRSWTVILGSTPQEINASVLALVTCVAALLPMWMFFFMEYYPNQRNSSREVNNFITRYLARMTDHYNRCVANAKSVTVGKEQNAQYMADEAQKWHKIVLWLGLRSFFIESFVRAVLFQINRNSSYYIFFIPLLFAVVLFAVGSMLLAYSPTEFSIIMGNLPWTFFVAFPVLIVAYFWFLNRSMKSIQEFNQREWIGFDNLQLEEVIGSIVGKYAEDVGYWKTRVGNSGF